MYISAKFYTNGGASHNSLILVFFTFIYLMKVHVNKSHLLVTEKSGIYI